MPNFKESVGYTMRSSIKKLTSALKLSRAGKEMDADIRLRPTSAAKKAAPTKLSRAGKEMDADIRLRPTSAAKKSSPTKDSRFGYLHGKESGRRKRPTSAARKQYKTEGPSRRPSKRA